MGELKDTGKPAASPGTRSPERPLSLGNVRAERHAEMAYTYYLMHGPDGTATEAYLSDKGRALGLSFQDLRVAALSEVERIKADPFGDSTADPDLQNDDPNVRENAMAKRSLNRVSESLQERLNAPLLVRGYGTFFNRVNDDLVGQFLAMQQLGLAQAQRFTSEQRATLRFAHVYGAVTVEEDDFLFVEHVTDARPLQWLRDETDLLYRRLENTYGRSYQGFIPTGEIREIVDVFPELHKHLLADPHNTDDTYIVPSRIQTSLETILEAPLHDIHGKNILKRPGSDGRSEFVIIDQPYIDLINHRSYLARENRAKMVLPDWHKAHML